MTMAVAPKPPHFEADAQFRTVRRNMLALVRLEGISGPNEVFNTKG